MNTRTWITRLRLSIKMQPGDLFDNEPSVPKQEPMQREGRHFTGQKFQKDASDLKQFLLSEGKALDADELQRAVEVTGLNFSAPQLRAAAAIYNLLDSTDFKGNVTPEPEREYKASHFRGQLPRLQFTPAEFLRLYGIKRKRDGGLDCHEAETAFEALKSFKQPFRIVYRKPASYKNGEPAAYHTVVVEQGLISSLDDYGILQKTDSVQVVHRDVRDKIKHITIALSPLWVDEITSWYLRRPVTLYQEIRDFHHGHRFSDAVYLFADFLLSLDFSPIRIYVDTLERRLWLDRHRKQGQPGRARTAVEDALKTALHVRLLEAYRADGLGAVILDLNPDRCKLIAAKRSRQ